MTAQGEKRGNLPERPDVFPSAEALDTFDAIADVRRSLDRLSVAVADLNRAELQARTLSDFPQRFAVTIEPEDLFRGEVQ